MGVPVPQCRELGDKKAVNADRKRDDDLRRRDRLSIRQGPFELEFCAKPLRGRSEVTPYMAGLLDWDQKLLLIAM